MEEQEKHRTIRVAVRDQEAEIDEIIAPLIAEIWRAGLRTLNSCQENRPGIAWIEFFDTPDATEFLNIVGGEYDDNFFGLYNRIRGSWNSKEHLVQGIWEFSLRPTDLSFEFWDDDDEVPDPPDFMFHVSIRFPQTDVPLLVERMKGQARFR